MSGSNVSTDLRQGIDSARAGHRLLARLHLAQAIDADPKNDAHWLWMAWVAESPAAAVDHLRKALEHNPGNEIARAGLVWSQTMADWDFAKPLSPRDTLAAVAEREAAATPAIPSFPIRMPRVDELHGDSSRSFKDSSMLFQPAAELQTAEAPKAESDADVDVEALHEFDLEAAKPTDAAAELHVETKAHADASSSVQIQDRRPASDPNRPESIPIDQMTGMFTGEGQQLVGEEFAGFDMAPGAIQDRRPMSDPDRPESIPIDQMTGMFTGEGQLLLGEEFSGFNMAPGTVDAVSDPTASLATPFPGGLTVGRLTDRRPPSAELVTPFTPPSESSDEIPSVNSESDFETIPPQTGMPESEREVIAEAASEGFNPPESAAEDGTARKVLIVDDSPTVCKIVSITLRKRGFEVASAGDGVEAMAMIAADQPHLILLDITMPRMDGYQLCKLIKGYPQTKQIPVIMLSGKDGFFDRVRGKLVGCADYITKPFDPEMLTAAVERFLPAPTAAAAAT
jgi:twitching motility two-component system response regulator PilG